MLCINENIQEQLQLPILEEDADFHPAAGGMKISINPLNPRHQRSH